MKKIFITILMVIGLIFINFNTFADSLEEDLTINNETIKYYQTNDVVTIPKTYQNDLFEMRGMWVATVWNGDFKTVASVNSFKSQYLKILDNLEKNNFNTILFQIRPSNDAFYVSELNPFSEWMTGIQGKAIKNSDGSVFDPLEWMIEVTHQRNIQFMGWMNAYRVSARTLFSDSSNNHSESDVKKAVDTAIKGLDDINFAKKYPKYVLLGDNDTKLILNPGEPMVRKHIINSIEEIVRKYDIDGVHFDDYFYLDSSNASKAEVVVTNETQYKTADTAFNDYYNDYVTYSTYKLENETLANFRRRSVNIMIEEISKMIKNVNSELKKSVQFGSKPAAVWTSSGRSVAGRIKGANVQTYSYSSYFDIFADSLYWAEQGWVDWIAPQIYFNYTNKEVPYADIVKWWAEAITNANNNLKAQGKEEVRLYIAHGAYRMSTSEPLEKQITDSTELVKQLLYNQKFDVIKGSAFYDYSTYFASSKLATESRSNVLKLFKSKAIPFSKGTKGNIFISNFEKEKLDDNTTNITIKAKNTDVLGYALYSNNQFIDFKYLNESKLTFNLEDDKKYQLKEVYKDYLISNNYLEIDSNTNVNCLDAYVGDTLNLDDTIKGYTDFTNSNENIIKLENNQFKALKKGNCMLSFEVNGEVVYYFVQVYNNNEYQIDVNTNDGYEISVITEAPYRENKDLILKVKIDDNYLYNNGKLLVNQQEIDISSYPQEFEINLGQIRTNYTISLKGVNIKTYTVIIDNGGEIKNYNVTHGDNIELPVPNESLGNKFVGWSHDGTNITESIKITANFEFAMVKVSFEENGGKELDDLELYYLEPIIEVTPTKEGFTFKGWYLDAEFTKPLDNMMLLKEDLVLYAKWEKNGGCNNSLISIYKTFMVFLPLVFVIKKTKKNY